MGGVALLLLLSLFACDKEKKNEPQGTKIESISFKQENYIVELSQTEGVKLREDLVIAPAAITDTCIVKWALTNPDVASISQDGVITPKKVGETLVTATVQDKSAQCKFKVEKEVIHVESVKVTPENFTADAKVGATKKLTAIVSPDNATDKTVTWTSSNTAVATVGSDGTVTCKGVGTATITATCDGKSGTCSVKYTQPIIRVESVTMSRTSATLLSVGMSGGRDIGILSLDATVTPSNATYPTVKWESSNSSVASVNKYGIVIANAEGTATITATADGQSATCEVTVKPAAYITDRENNMYLTVKIGNQWWMADNLRCKTYDSDSERAGYSLSTSSVPSYAPYYSDASNKDHWEVYGPVYLSDEQVAELGYLYSWAAAVGLESESAAKDQKSSFSSRRQGICPNGWHLPTDSEWTILGNYVGSDGGRKLKTTSGWGVNRNGTDDYFFGALPAGDAVGSTLQSVGEIAVFWTATPSDSEIAYVRMLNGSSELNGGFHYEKSYGRSVRCVKN